MRLRTRPANVLLGDVLMYASILSHHWLKKTCFIFDCYASHPAMTHCMTRVVCFVFDFVMLLFEYIRN